MTKQHSAPDDSPALLAVNAGSSSIKFAVYRAGETLEPGLHGSIDRIGLSGTQLRYVDPVLSHAAQREVEAADLRAAGNLLLDWLDEQIGLESLAAVGHRIVQGMDFAQPQPVTPELVDALRRVADYDPDHMPGELALIEAFAERRPQLKQLACFDTSFHRTMPRVATLLPIPRRYHAQGVKRYGFHGISYAYLMQRLAHLAGAQAARGRVILAHLGNGESLAAVRDGRCIDTSMGFTPTGGVPMGTRSGDLDPGVAWYLIQSEKLSPQAFSDLINRQSGLLGIAETTSDMRELLDREAGDPRAADAVAVFCYQVKKWIGAFAAALGGLDTLVFAGGMGENSAQIRSRICSDLHLLGIEVDPQRNTACENVISPDSSPVTVRVIRTDEQWMIASSVCQFLGLPIREDRHVNANDER